MYFVQTHVQKIPKIQWGSQPLITLWIRTVIPHFASASGEFRPSDPLNVVAPFVLLSVVNVTLPRE